MAKKALIAVFLVTVVLVTCWCLLCQFVVFVVPGEDDRGGRAKADLDLLAYAVTVVARVDEFTPADWDKINTMKDLAPRLAPRLEQGEYGLLDPWGNQYLLETREETEEIIITIRSSHERGRNWCTLRKDIFAVEITVSRRDGQVTNRRDFWR
jgi:hypothetical protein